jgi:hypothetical protein
VFAYMDERYTSPQSREFSAKIERVFFLARLGQVLRLQNDQVVRQPIPEKLQKLVQQLERAERQDK